MEIPGLFPHFHVCESDCGATVLHSAKASTEMLGALRTSLCPYPKRQLHSQLRNGAGFERSPIKPRAQVPRISQERWGFWHYPRSLLLPPSQPGSSVTTPWVQNKFKSPPCTEPNPGIVCAWAKQDESLLELNEGSIYANFKA